MAESFNNRIRQLVLLSVILLIAYLIVRELYVLLPGILGAVTLYIIGRDLYFRIVEKRRWKPGLAALLIMLAFLSIIAFPFYYAFHMVTPRLYSVFSHSDELLQGVKALSERLSDMVGIEVLSADSIVGLQKAAANFIPTFLNSTANILFNVVVMFFLLYFMFTSGRVMERHLMAYLPLSRSSIDVLARETLQSVRANAIGIPLISLIQGVTALIGYAIFGLKDWGMWGFLTGIFAFFPIVGTMVVWVPLVIYLYSQGLQGQGTGLLVYSLLVTGNVDYFARITLMKRIGDVHPLVTVFGVIVGLSLFGFMGFIFGPLLFGYLILLVRIYTYEFVNHSFRDLGAQ